MTVGGGVGTTGVGVTPGEASAGFAATASDPRTPCRAASNSAGVTALPVGGFGHDTAVSAVGSGDGVGLSVGVVVGATGDADGDGDGDGDGDTGAEGEPLGVSLDDALGVDRSVAGTMETADPQPATRSATSSSGRSPLGTRSPQREWAPRVGADLDGTHTDGAVDCQSCRPRSTS
jgi:hypothetical protein